MSRTELWGIKPDFTGKVIAEFKNSWLFAPVVWDELVKKYTKPKWYDNGKPMYSSIIFDQGTWKEINDIMNGSDNDSERVCWELSNQNVFFTKDRSAVADMLTRFHDVHMVKGSFSRFIELADSVRRIDPSEYIAFVLHNTTVDDTVKSWFSTYNEDTEEYEPIHLSTDTFQAEFCVMDGTRITEFISNYKYKPLLDMYGADSEAIGR